MAKALVVVESPSKAKTIKKYLGSGYDVKASVGHVKDLPKSQIGVDIDGGFEPRYETIRGKGKVLADIRKAAKTADVIYLAPDPDREGEAIAWHIASELDVPPERIKRVLFNEITKKAIEEAIDNPLDLNQNRFNSQQARRILDRLVGYQISPLLWDKVRRGLSAGRVQSVAVRLVVEREKEILAFEPQEYWHIDAMLEAPELPPEFKARLVKIDGKKADVTNEAEAKAALAAIGSGPFSVAEVKKKERQKRPLAPFTTSRLQQDAARAYRFTAKRTMTVAQQLYEGIELGEEGAVGLITYMRTDSTRLSNDAVDAARTYIGGRYGERYVPAKPNVYKSKGRAQDAHEAIRPTSLDYAPNRIKQHLTSEQFNLYSLIWKRFLACQMTPAIFATTSIEIDAPEAHQFRATGSIKIFDGFTRVYEETKGMDDEQEQVSTLPNVDAGQPLNLLKIDPQQKFTQPPPRFTEATLIKECEERGIGRPSTYAAIISTIQSKKYVEKEKGRFSPTELGSIVTELLVQSFPKLFDPGFTARMEDELDQVEDGKTDWKELLGDFWGRLSKTLETARTEMRNVKREEKETNLECPRDAGNLVIKFGKNGSFLACKNYPDCRFTGEVVRDEKGEVSLAKEESLGEDCKECEGGSLLYKSGRYGRFIGCSNYPTCKYTRPISTGVDCPECSKGYLTEKKSRKGRTFYSCSTYPKCKYAQWDRPIPTPCPHCANPWVDQKNLRSGPGAVVCPSCKAELPQE